MVPLFGQVLRIPLRQELFKAGEQVTVMMRPEAIRLVRDPSLKQVKIEQVMYLGREVEYTITFDNHTWAVADTDPRAGRAFAEGETVGMTMVEDATHLLSP